MSVKFNQSSFTVEVQTGSNPIESWMETQNELFDSLQSESQVKSERCHYIELLRSMMPDEETAKKMLIGV